MKRVASSLLLACALLTSAVARAQTPAEYDRFNAAMSIGVSHYADRIRDVRIGTSTVIATDDRDSNGFAFALDFMRPFGAGAFWLGLSLAVSSDADGRIQAFGRKDRLTHGALALQGRYNFRAAETGSWYPFLGAEAGMFSQSFMVPYQGAPLRLSAAGNGGSLLLGMQRRDGLFVSLLLHGYRLDEFDVEQHGATQKLPISGTVTGSGLQLHLGYRWF